MGLHRYRFENAEFDEAQGVLSVDGAPVTVEPLPLQLLAILLQRADEVVPRADLFGALWHDRPTVDHVLANAVSKLRRALGEAAGTRLLNVPRVGYRLAGPVERVAVGRRRECALRLAAGQAVPGHDDFVLVRPLGDAAVGTVWLAEHRRLAQRWVFKFAHDSDQLAALQREFATGRLLIEQLGPRDDLVQPRARHLSGLPAYIAYEEGGLDLRTWAGQAQRLHGLGVEQRIAVFLDIARAVAAVHRVGVLHRDLHPGNVRVETGDDPAGASTAWRVRLGGFGSDPLPAPDVTGAGITATEANALRSNATPHCLAPELLLGAAASPRSDLYALGLMLYQLLAGDLARPLATGWEHDIADPLLVDDVRAATEGRPERRLASVDRLVERLTTLDQRRLDRATTAAAAVRAEAAASRSRALRARRPWVAALCLSLALGGLGAGWLAVQARAAERLGEQARARARAINDFLNEDLLPARHLAGPTQVQGWSSMELVARASDRAGERFKDDPPVLAQVRRQLGDIYLGMRFRDRAESEYRRAITILQASGHPDDADLLAARYGLAEALTDRGRPEAALAALESADQAAGERGRIGNDALGRRALEARVQVLIDARRDQDALPDAERLLALSESPGDDGRLDDWQRIEARQLRGEIALDLGDTARAAVLADELAGPPFHARQVGTAMQVRSRLRQIDDLLRSDRPAQAEQALTGLREAVQRDAASDGLLSGLVERAWAQVHRKSGRREEAYRSSVAAVQALTVALGEQHALVTRARIELGLAELDIGQADQALRDLDAARARLDADGHQGEVLQAIDQGRTRALAALGRSVGGAAESDGADSVPARLAAAGTAARPPASR